MTAVAIINNGATGLVVRNNLNANFAVLDKPVWLLKTAAYTALSGDRIAADTTIAFTVTLPASPVANDFIQFADYKQNFSIGNLTIARNGSNIDGGIVNKVLNVSGQTLTLTYIDATVGWLSSNFDRPDRPVWIIKTAAYTALSGDRIAANTTVAFTITLPASPVANDFVKFADYKQNFAVGNLTIARNGSNIDGGIVNKVLNVSGQTLTLTYIDATVGWLSSV